MTQNKVLLPTRSIIYILLAAQTLVLHPIPLNVHNSPQKKRVSNIY